MKIRARLALLLLPLLAFPARAQWKHRSIPANGPIASATPEAVEAVGLMPPAVDVAVASERGGLAADVPETAWVRVALSGVPRPGVPRPAVNLAFAVDRSAATADGRLAAAREAVAEAIGRLGERDLFAVVAFDRDAAEVLVPAAPATGPGRAAAAAKVRALAPGAAGGSRPFWGVCAGAEEVRKGLARGLPNRVFLLSDAAADADMPEPDALGRLAAALAKEGVSVVRIAAGTDAGGTSRALGEALGEAFETAALDVRLAVRFRGAHPVALDGADGRIEDDSVSLSFGALRAGAARSFRVRTEFDPGRDGETRPFASWEAAWRLPGGEGRHAALGAAVPVVFGAPPPASAKEDRP